MLLVLRSATASGAAFALEVNLPEGRGDGRVGFNYAGKIGGEGAEDDFAAKKTALEVSSRYAGEELHDIIRIRPGALEVELRGKWRVGRVAEGGGLLNRCRTKSSTGGSNPPLSAIKSKSFRMCNLSD